MVSILGNWVNEIPCLKKKFKYNKPFKHIVISNFLEPIFMEKVHSEFNEASSGNFEDWCNYNNPLEVKYASNNITTCRGNSKSSFVIVHVPPNPAFSYFDRNN